jgi:PIN domain nuclease of toxin-antitoxin system
MRVLLDTHAFLWLIAGDRRLSKQAIAAYTDRENLMFLSAASFWEICIKKSLGKVSLKSGWIQIIQNEMTANSIQWLPIEVQHCTEVIHLPFHHRDPFDRLLIAQAIAEEMRLMSRDRRFSDYAIDRIW